jgi:mercuric ion transport protein
MQRTIMIVEEENQLAAMQLGQRLMAAGGLLAASAASSCCIVPLILFSLGVSGAWIGNFTRLASYQSYFLAATIAFLGAGYWLVYRASKRGCADGGACARPLPNRFVKAGLIIATVLVVASLGLDLLSPLFGDL